MTNEAKDKSRADVIIDIVKAIFKLSTGKFIALLVFLTVIGFFIYRYYLVKEVTEVNPEKATEMVAPVKELPVEEAK